MLDAAWLWVQLGPLERYRSRGPFEFWGGELHAADLERSSDRAAIATRLRDRCRALSVRAGVDVERMVAMHAAGLTDDQVTTPSEARMRYYDPTVDDAVPPEPFVDD